MLLIFVLKWERYRRLQPRMLLDTVWRGMQPSRNCYSQQYQRNKRSWNRYIRRNYRSTEKKATTCAVADSVVWASQPDCMGVAVARHVQTNNCASVDITYVTVGLNSLFQQRMNEK